MQKIKSNLKINISKLTLKCISALHYAWIIGAILPLLYSIFFINIKKIFSFLRYLNLTKSIFLSFILVQLISISLSIFLDFFSLSRFFAILHNLFAFCFFIFGYYFGNNYINTKSLKKTFRGLFYFTSLLSIIMFFVSFLTSTHIQYPGLMAILTGIKNDITQVTFTHLGFLMEIPIPRSRIMGTFPNTTAILLLLFFVLYRYFYDTKKLISGLLLLIACITTGSRMATLIAVILCITQFVISRRRLMAFIILSLCLIFPGIFAAKKIVALRENSNDSRKDLYIESINLSLKENPFFGIGIKPRLKEIANGELPVGSHSTVIGYFVKNGFIGLMLIVIVYFLITLFSFYSICFHLFKHMQNEKSFFIVSSTFLVSLIFVTDDFDSYEMIPLFFGILITLFEHEINSIVRFKNCLNSYKTYI